MQGRWTLLLLAATTAALVASPADAQETKVVDMTYEVGGLDPGDGTVDVDLVFEGADGAIDHILFRTESHRYDVSNVTAAGGTLEEVPGGYKLEFEPGPTVLRYTVGVEKETFKGAEGFNAVLTEEWGVLKAEALGIGFEMSHQARYDIVWDTELRFLLPDGWGSAGPWNATGDNAYDLARDQALPRGFYAVGGDLDVTTREGPWKTYRYVQIGRDLDYEADLLPYLQEATPYYASVYGNHTGPNLLAVSAPDPMHQGGLGGWNSLYVHEETDIETLAHEYAHVWQLYRPVRTVDNPQGIQALEGGSSLWIVEGDADYRGPLSLVATEFWSPSEADEHFEDVERRADREDRLTVPLADATYGNTHEEVAYEKGALVLHAFQRALSSATDGAADSATLVRTLNREHSPLADGYHDQSFHEQRVNNSELRAVLLDLASSADAADRDAIASDFDAYVHGDKAPSFDSIERSGHLSFSDLVIDPPTAQEGSPSAATVHVTNTGPTDETREVELLVDGEVADVERVTLRPGGSREVTLTLPDLTPGTYDVRVAYLEARYRVLEPPDLVLAELDVVPPQVTEGEEAAVLATVENRGGAAGEAVVDVALDGAPAGAARRSVGGGVAETLSVAVRPDEPGTREVQATLSHGNDTLGTVTATLEVDADGDGDGVPDRDDAYPGNPDLAQGSTVNDVRNVVPAGPWAAAALGAGALAARRSRSRGRR